MLIFTGEVVIVAGCFLGTMHQLGHYTHHQVALPALIAILLNQ